MPVFNIHHVTRYEYEKPIKESVNEIRLFGLNCPEQEILQQEIHVTHQPDIQIYRDYYGNKVGIFSIPEPHLSLQIDCKMLVRTIQTKPNAAGSDAGFEALQQEMADRLPLLECSMYHPIANQSVIDEIAGVISKNETSIFRIVEKASHYVFSHFTYTKGITNIFTTVDELLNHKSGVCQDFAHVLLQILRTLGIPARYVSGYICANSNGVRGQGATHAWVEAWIPGSGWTGIDPTNNVWVTMHHVKLSVGRSFSDCTPTKGIYKGNARQNLSVYVSVGYEDGLRYEDTSIVQMETESFSPNLISTAGPENHQHQQ
jgi:transglutaminase-like putative cysteine protease